MMHISVIAAIDKNNAIGKDNNLLCYLPNDLNYFKRTTSGHTVIMGRKTFESLPNGALPNRRNIVLSKNKEFECKDCELAFSLKEAVSMCKDDEKVFIIGGSSIYKQAIEIADQLLVTRIDYSFEGADSFFPTIDSRVWKEESITVNDTDEKNKYKHSFISYSRIK